MKKKISGKVRTVLKTLIACLLILGAAAALVFGIFSTEPEAVRETATRKSAMLVSVEPVVVGNYNPVIEVLGTVVPAREIHLSPRVEGEVTFVSDHFIPGGRVSKGEVLVEIDSADYEIAVRQAKSDVSRAEADLKLEKGRKTVAEMDFELMEQEVENVNQDLALRVPQMESAVASVEAAEAALARAELNLERTRIHAPFDALILSREVNLGSQVNAGMQLAHLIGTDEYWVQVTVPQFVVQRLSIPETPGETGSAAVIRNQTGWESDAMRTGHIYSLTGALEENTRLAQVIVSVKDPLAMETDEARLPRLLVGSIVQIELQLNEMNNVVRMNRDYLRKNDTVWVKKDGVLEIRDVTVGFKNVDYAFITEGLSDGDEVVISNISRVVDGSELRTESADETSPQTPVEKGE